jgi:hypothetical protein
MKKISALSLFTAMAVAVPTAQASDLNINGFISVGASMLTDQKASIADADTQGGFKSDTVLGLQISKQINDTTSATGQLVSRGTDDYSTEAAWAFVTYAANDDLDLRMGRLRIPFFVYSDFLEVGYAYNWVRTPEEVYRIPISSIDGIDLTQRFSTGDIDGSVQAYYGRFQGDFVGYDADFRNFAGIAFSANMGNFGTRMSYHQTEQIIDISDTSAGLGYLATVATSLAGGSSAGDDFNFTGQLAQFYEAAVTYDDGTYSAVAEWTALEHGSSLLADDQGFLVSVAARLGDFTPHLTYSSEKGEYDSGTEGDIQKILGLRAEQTSITAGVRYDYDSGTALKFEIQSNDEKDVYASSPSDESTISYSVAVDLVF